MSAREGGGVPTYVQLAILDASDEARFVGGRVFDFGNKFALV
jgi:hypothetical protein